MDVNLVLFKKNGSQKSFSLPSEVTIIGRRHDCDMYIPLKPISRKHCQLSLNNGTLELRDLGSRNGTYVNGERVEQHQLQAGDYIQIPPVTLLVQIDGKPEKIAPPTPAEERAPSGAGAAGPKEPGKQERKEEKAKGEQDEPIDLDLDENDEFADLDAEASDSFLEELEDL